MATGEEPQPAGSASLSRSVEKALEEAAGSGVLNLSNRKLRDFPPAAAKHDLSDLTQADLSKNRLSEIPCELCQYISLETLNLYHNCVRTIPSAITNLQALTYLNLSRSQLCVLPPFLCCLPLKVLITSNNKLTSLPENIGCLRQLRELDVSCNEIQMLPSQIGNLESLRDLNLRRNQLVTLPEELSELPLVRLDFSCNKVTRIPVCYRHLRHLQNILLDNNPLQSPPAQICTKGKIHIFKYLNIEACKAVPDLSDLERSMRPHGFGSCLPDELCGSRQHSDQDSGFNSVDSGSKRWSGNESTDEFTDLSLRMVEISRGQRQLRDSRPSGQAENSTDVDLEQIEFMDCLLDREEEKEALTTPSAGRSPRTAASPEDRKQSRNSYSERLPPNGASEENSPGKDEAHREGDERRRPETLQIWQAREKQLQSQSAERQERRASLSLMAKTAPFILQSQTSLSDPSSKTTSGGSSGNSASAQTQQRSDSRPANVSTTAARPDPTGNSVPPPGGRDSAPGVSRPNSFLFRSSTRGNLKSTSVMSPVSPQSPTYTFPEFPADLNPTARSRKVDQELSEQEVITQLRKNIETRLNRTLPGELGEALNNGVVLCQLVNHVRPRSISIIHIPSPAVPKLSMAKSRRNVESFLEACRKIGVPQDSLCQPGHILEEEVEGLLKIAQTVRSLEIAAKPRQVRLSSQD